MDPRTTYSIDPLQKEILTFRHERRQKLREQYLKEIQHPVKGPNIVHPAILRCCAARTHGHMYGVQYVRPWNYILGLLYFGGTTTLMVQSMIRNRDEIHDLLRAGKLTYTQRHRYKILSNEYVEPLKSIDIA